MQKSIYVFDTRIEIDPLIAFCRETGTDTLILHPGFFSDEEWIEKPRRNGLKIWLNFPVLYDEQYLKNNPHAYGITSKGNKAAHSWLHMACPLNEEYLEIKRNEFRRAVESVRPDVISYDFIRFYVFWEEVEIAQTPGNIEYGCFCPNCLKSYSRYVGENDLTVHEINLPERRKSLGEWKCSIIESIIESFNSMIDVSFKDIPVYIKTIPWNASDLDGGLAWIAGQKISRLAELSDGLMPMAFPQILGRSFEWKKKVFDSVEEETGKKVMSIIQFEPLIRQTEISNETLETDIANAINEKRKGLLYFHYEQIMNNGPKRDILKKFSDA